MPQLSLFVGGDLRMRLKDYDGQDGKKVWLDRDEVDLFLEQADGTMQRIAYGLGVRCGLRAKEIASVTPPDIVTSSTGPRVRVWRGKGDKHREVPVPEDLRASIEALADVRDDASDVPVVDRSTRTVERWVQRGSEKSQAESGDVGWSYLGPHDLRRTWGTLLVEAGVEPGMIMEWGGWDDWDTFREHYLGAYSPEMERRQASLVPWLDVAVEEHGSGGASPRGHAFGTGP